MSIDRRSLIKATPLGLAALAAAVAPTPLIAREDGRDPEAPEPAPVAYTFFRPSEAAFAEHLATHMVPADELSPSGNDLGIPVYMDRALASGWGKGDRLYLQGPFAQGTRNQGYQLALSPARLFRQGTEALLQYARETLNKDFFELDGPALDRLLLGLRSGEVQLPQEIPSTEYFALVYGMVREGLFADPAYGGNRDKAGWRMLGFPGVIQSNKLNIARYRNRRHDAEPLAIADVSGWTSGS